MAKKDTESTADEALGSADPRVYEIGFHLDPELPTEAVKKEYQKIRAVILQKSAIVAEGEPQTLQLAYTISRQEQSGRRDFKSAYFCWIAYESSTEVHLDIIKAVNSNDKIIRFIDVITTKEAARHAAEMHEIAAKTANRSQREKETAGAEETETISEEIDAALEHAAV